MRDRKVLRRYGPVLLCRSCYMLASARVKREVRDAAIERVQAKMAARRVRNSDTSEDAAAPSL